jgi:hypothetical protein
MKIVKMIVATMGVTALVATAAMANTVALWDFNTQWTSPAMPAASIGTGSMSYVGTAAGYKSTGKPDGWTTDWSATDGHSSDPAATSANIYGAFAINTMNQPQGSGPLSGLQWNVSTVGMQNITLSLDARLSGSTSRAFQWEYTVDGTNWIVGPSVTFAAGTAWQNNNVLDLSSITAANDNANFGFQFLNASASEYNSNTIRVDMVTVSGTPNVVPEPGSLMALATGLTGLIGLARKRTR